MIDKSNKTMVITRGVLVFEKFIWKTGKKIIHIHFFIIVRLANRNEVGKREFSFLNFLRFYGSPIWAAH